ncbi:AAA family ATPase, partial [Spirosoma agri]
MIHEFTKIKSVGKFRAFDKKGDLTFRDLTLIYAENGRGKTTLTNILRSLSNSDGNLIHSRKSTNSTEETNVELTFWDHDAVKKLAAFGRKGWNTQLSSIEIFDCFFIDENIYSGFDFNNDHKTGLYKFILGSEGVKIGELIIKNKDEKSKKRQHQERAKSTIIELCDNHQFETPYNSLWFSKIKETELDHIDDKINKAIEDLAQSLEGEKITKKGNLLKDEKWSLNIDFNSLVDELQVSLSSIQNLTLEELFKEHIAELTNSGIDNAESWAKNGLSYVFYHEAHKESHKETNCPFCRKPISNEQDIITAYTQKFNSHYQIHVKKLQNFLHEFDEINIDLEYTKRKVREDKFQEDLKYWETYLQSNEQIIYPNINGDLCVTYVSAIKVSLESKIASPANIISKECVDNFTNYLNTFNRDIDIYSSKVDTYNSKIISFKASLKSPQEAKSNLLKLKLIKRRYDTDVIECLQDLFNLKKELTDLEEDYKKLMVDQEKEAEDFIVQYGTSVNEYLKSIFKTPYTLEKIARQAPTGRSVVAKVDYSLYFDNHEISSKPDASLNTKYCLSEGDKSTIALAFFLA